MKSWSPKEQLKILIHLIIDNVLTEKILQLPIRSYPIPTPTLMLQQLPTYHLLVLSRERKKINVQELQRKVELYYAHIATIHVIIWDIHSFNQHLREQPYFFPELGEKKVLYDYGTIPLASSTRDIDMVLLRRSLRQNFSFLLNKSEELFTKAFEEWKTGAMNLPALSESIWHIYIAIEIVFTGYDPQVRDLFRLRRSATRFSGNFAFLFPQHTRKEKYLFNYLHRSLINKLSKLKTPMDTLLFEAALKRVQYAQMIALLVCQEHINNLKSYEK